MYNSKLNRYKTQLAFIPYVQIVKNGTWKFSSYWISFFLQRAWEQSIKTGGESWSCGQCLIKKIKKKTTVGTEHVRLGRERTAFCKWKKKLHKITKKTQPNIQKPKEGTVHSEKQMEEEMKT